MRQIFNAFYLLIFIKFIRTIAIRFSCRHVFKIIVPIGDHGYLLFGRANTVSESVKFMNMLARSNWTVRAVLCVKEDNGRLVASKGNPSDVTVWANCYGERPEYSVFDDIPKTFELPPHYVSELRKLALSLGQTPITTKAAKCSDK